jgi:hypothetical protein
MSEAERAIDIVDAYEAAKLEVKMYTDLDAYSYHNGPFLRDEHVKLCDQFCQGDKFKQATLGFAMAFAKPHFRFYSGKNLDVPEAPVGSLARIIRNFVEGLVPTLTSGRFQGIDLETRKKICEDIVAKMIASSPTVKARERWRKNKRTGSQARPAGELRKLWLVGRDQGNENKPERSWRRF